MSKIGRLPAAFSAASIFSFSITSGMILVPATLSPFLSENRHVWKRSSFLPENSQPQVHHDVFSEYHSIFDTTSILTFFDLSSMYFGRISGTDFVKDLCSFIFVKDPGFSPTQKVFFPTGEQQRYILFFHYIALFEKNAFFSSFMICVISWHRMWPTASSVLISFIQNPFPVLLFLQSVVLYIQSALFVKICCRHHKRNA